MSFILPTLYNTVVALHLRTAAGVYRRTGNVDKRRESISKHFSFWDHLSTDMQAAPVPTAGSNACYIYVCVIKPIMFEASRFSVLTFRSRGDFTASLSPVGSCETPSVFVRSRHVVSESAPVRLMGVSVFQARRVIVRLYCRATRHRCVRSFTSSPFRPPSWPIR